jgi:hypothetical protein
MEDGTPAVLDLFSPIQNVIPDQFPELLDTDAELVCRFHFGEVCFVRFARCHACKDP